MILHGLNESTEKYAELIAYFLQEGFSVLIYDQRGRGRSVRSAPARRIHIDRFEEYVEDARCAVQGPLSSCPPPYHLFAHSMGGAVAALLLEGEHPFARAVLSSPMIQPFRYPLIPPAAVRLLCRAVTLCGGGKKRVLVLKEPSGEEDFANSCALSEARFNAYAALRKSRPEYASGAISYSWAACAIGVTKKILKKGAPEGVSIPVRIYAAERDHLVENKPARQFAKRLPHGEFVLIKNSKHEIYQASDDILHPYLDSVISFFGEI
jgi:lysophospholipase